MKAISGGSSSRTKKVPCSWNCRSLSAWWERCWCHRLRRLAQSQHCCRRPRWWSRRTWRNSTGHMFDSPHRRFNPLTGDWVLVSPQRAGRPWLGQIEKIPPENLPAYDPTCYLCPGNARAGGVRNPDYGGTFVFDNDFAALHPEEVEPGEE